MKVIKGRGWSGDIDVGRAGTSGRNRENVTEGSSKGGEGETVTLEEEAGTTFPVAVFTGRHAPTRFPGARRPARTCCSALQLGSLQFVVRVTGSAVI